MYYRRIRISISSICFHRDIFPGSCFKRREYGSEKMSAHIYTLEPAVMDGEDVVVRNQDAFNVTQWLEQGVFKALEDQYLDQLTFAIFTSHPITGDDMLLETYEFKCTYPGISADGKIIKPKMNNQSLDKQALKSQANKFVRSLIEFSSTLEDIPEERWITIELAYTANCPRNYQPEYFVDNTGNGIGFLEGVNLLKIKIGNINTDHHNLDMRFKGREHLNKETLSIIERVTCEDDRSQCLQPSSSCIPPSQDDHLNHVDSEGRVRCRSCSSFAARAPALATNEGVRSPPSSSFPPTIATMTSTSTSSNAFISTQIFPMKRKSDVTIDTAFEKKCDKICETDFNNPQHGQSRRVCQYVLRQNCAIVMETAKALRLDINEVRQIFQQLVSEGFLNRGKDGSGYIICDNEPRERPPSFSNVDGLRKDADIDTSSGTSKRPLCSDRRKGFPASEGSETDDKIETQSSGHDDATTGASLDTEIQNVIVDPDHAAKNIQDDDTFGDDAESMSDQSLEYLPKSRISGKTLSSRAPSQHVIQHPSQKPIAIRHKKRDMDSASLESPSYPLKKNRKTSIIANPKHMQAGNHGEVANFGSQLECYGYSLGQSLSPQ